jgi:hypothetical protein
VGDPDGAFAVAAKVIDADYRGAVSGPYGVRAGNLRDPDGPQVTFALESFIDELVLAALQAARI